jgi:hypothetical protein
MIGRVKRHLRDALTDYRHFDGSSRIEIPSGGVGLKPAALLQ